MPAGLSECRMGARKTTHGLPAGGQAGGREGAPARGVADSAWQDDDWCAQSLVNSSRLLMIMRRRAATWLGPASVNFTLVHVRVDGTGGQRAGHCAASSSVSMRRSVHPNVRQLAPLSTSLASNATQRRVYALWMNEWMNEWTVSLV